MGISLEQYRARTGCFAQRGPDIQQKNQPVKRKERKEKAAVTAETKPPVSTTTAATSVSTKGEQRREHHAQLCRTPSLWLLLVLGMFRRGASDGKDGGETSNNETADAPAGALTTQTKPGDADQTAENGTTTVAPTGDDAKDNTTDTGVSTAVPVKSTTNNVGDAQTDGKDGGETSNNETTDAPAGALTTQTKPGDADQAAESDTTTVAPTDGEGATVEEQATPAATSESVSPEGAASTDAPQDSTFSPAPECQGDVCGEETDKHGEGATVEEQATPAATSESVSPEGAASTDAPQDSTFSPAPECRGDVCGEETDKQNVKREQFDKAQEKADMAITVELFKATKPRKENPVTPRISLHGTGKSSFIKRKRQWCIVILVLGMYGLPVSTATDPVPVDTYAGMYNRSLVSSCIPRDNRHISAVNDFYVNLLEIKIGTYAIWLPIQRRDLGGWYWLSGEYQGKTLSKYSEQGEDCAVLRAADMKFENVNCDRQYSKYICQTTDVSDPCFMHKNNTCFVIKGTQYTVVSQRSNWYDARAGCATLGEELATLPKANQQDMLEKIRQMTTSYYNIWVGLRRKDYFIDGGNTSVDGFYWRKGDTCPCKSNYSCVTLVKTPEGFFWKPRNCLDKIAYLVCIEPVRLEGEVTTPEQPSSEEEGEVTTTEYPLADKGNLRLLLLLLLLLLFPLCIGLLKYVAIRFKLSQDRYL